MFKIRNLFRSLYYFFMRPFNINTMGRGSIIRRPRLVKGTVHINIGNDVKVAPNSWIEGFFEYAGIAYKPIIEIDDNTTIGRFATITAIDNIYIGKNCLLSEYVYISDHAHDVFGEIHGPLVTQKLIPKGPVVIEDHCFIGFRAIIMPGVTLGERSVVGAGSVVTKSFPAKSIIAGVPAKLVRENI